MKKAGYFLLTLLEIALFAGGYAIHYFTKAKMGMARYVVYKNQGWNRDYPMDLYIKAALIILSVLTLIVLLLFLKKRRAVTRMTALVNGVMIITTTVYVAFTAIKSTETMRAYFFISLMLGLAAVIQVIKAIAALLIKPAKGSVEDEKRTS